MSKEKKDGSASVKINQVKALSIAEGFFESAILFALLQLRVFELIGEGARTLEELAGDVKAEPATLKRLLNAGVLLKVLEFDGGAGYRVAKSYHDVLIPSAGSNYLGNFILNLAQLREPLMKLNKAVLDSAPTVDPSSLLGSDKEQTREFTLAMHNYASSSGEELAEILDTSKCSTLLDLGCGPGTYAFYLGMKNPELKIHLLDFPGVLEIAKEIAVEFALENEVVYTPADVFKDDIEGSYDMVLISNTLHMLGERVSRELINKLYGVINKGGSLVIQARFLREDRTGDRWPVFLDLIQLCITEEGRNHTIQETRKWLEYAGFVNIEYDPMSVFNANSLLRAYKPE